MKVPCDVPFPFCGPDGCSKCGGAGEYEYPEPKASPNRPSKEIHLKCESCGSEFTEDREAVVNLPFCPALRVWTDPNLPEKLLTNGQACGGYLQEVEDANS